MRESTDRDSACLTGSLETRVPSRWGGGKVLSDALAASTIAREMGDAPEDRSLGALSFGGGGKQRMADNNLVKMPCQECGKKLGIRPDQFGRLIRCPACQHSFRANLLCPRPTMLPLLHLTNLYRPPPLVRTRMRRVRRKGKSAIGAVRVWGSCLASCPTCVSDVGRPTRI